MPLTPEDVQNKRFTTTRLKAGYDEDEVDGFLDEVEAEMRRLLAENTALRAATASAPAAPVAAAPEPPREDPNEAALRTLSMAQRTAEQAVAQARAEADQLLTSARAHAATIERDAKAEHAAKLAEFERGRAALEGKLNDLRGFERDHLTRVRAYLSGQLKELDKLESAASPLLSSSTRSGAPAVGGAPASSPAASPASSPVAPPPGAAPAGGGISVPRIATTPPVPAAPTPPATSVPPPTGEAAPAVPGTGAGTPFSSAPLPASPQDSPELFTPPATPPGDHFSTDVDADSDVPSGPPSQADEGETDDASH